MIKRIELQIASNHGSGLPVTEIVLAALHGEGYVVVPRKDMEAAVAKALDDADIGWRRAPAP